jgi:hypothetical protein
MSQNHFLERDAAAIVPENDFRSGAPQRSRQKRFS